MDVESFFEPTELAIALVEKFKKLNSAARSFFRMKAKVWIEGPSNDGKWTEESRWFSNLNNADQTDYLDIFGAYFWHEWAYKLDAEMEFETFCAIWRIDPCQT